MNKSSNLSILLIDNNQKHADKVLEKLKKTEFHPLTTEHITSLDDAKFAYGLVHDLQNNLTAMMGYTSLIQKELYHDSKLQKYTETITKAGKRASALTRKILNFVRKPETTIEKVNIHEILEEVITIINVNSLIKVKKNSTPKNIACQETLICFRIHS